MEQLFISGPIMALKRTTAEKLLLARICQRASLTAGVCSDTNNELAQATAMHLKTVSDLIGRLVEAELVSTMVDREQANRRNLMPRQDLLTDYPSNTDRVESGYPSNTDRVNEDRDPYPSITDSPVLNRQRRLKRLSRKCPMTGVDITHQRPNCRYASKLTLEKLQRKQPEVFSQLVERFLLPGERPHPYTLAERIRKLARVEAVERATPNRHCPVTGIDITHQGIHYPFVTNETIKTLYKVDRAAFVDLGIRLGLPDAPGEAMSTQCQRVISQVQQISQTIEPSYPIIRLGQPTTAPTEQTGVRRYCPLTCIDITHQQERHQFATAWTIEALFKSNRAGFDRVAAKLLPDSPRQDSGAGQCFALSGRVRKLAKAYQ